MEEAVLDLSRNKTQRAFVLSPHERCAFYGGVRNGKTLGGVARVLLLCDLWPGNEALVGRKTYQELRDTTWKELLVMVRKRNGGTLDPGPYVKRYLGGAAPELELQNGSKIMGRYADNIETMLSLTLGVVYLDQAEYIDREVFTHLDTRIMLWTDDRIKEARSTHQRLYGRPMQGTPRGFIFLTGNPKPGWVHQLFKLGLREDGTPIENSPYKLYEASTEENKANLPAGYIEDMRRTQSEAFIKRFVDVDDAWTAFEGQVYSEFYEALHVVSLKELPWTKPPAAWPRVVGMDHGQRNPTAAIFMAQDPDDNVLVYNEHYAISAILKEHADAILALAEGDSVDRPPDGKGILVHLDPSVRGDYTPEGVDFRELYAQFGIHSLPTNKNVLAGIQKVQELLHPDPERKFPDWHPRRGEKGSPRLFYIKERCPNLLAEMSLYEWEPPSASSPGVLKEKPFKHKDHALDAKRYGIMALRTLAPKLKAPKRPTFAETMHKRLLSNEEDELPWPAPSKGPTVIDGR